MTLEFQSRRIGNPRVFDPNGSKAVNDLGPSSVGRIGAGSARLRSAGLGVAEQPCRKPPRCALMGREGRRSPLRPPHRPAKRRPPGQASL